MQFMGGRRVNYFKEKKVENNDTFKREEEKSRTSLYEAADYDIKFVNRILNKPILTEGDKYNIASVLEWFNYELREINDHACEYEKVTRDFLGEETYNDLTKAYINYKMSGFEERIRNE